MRPLVQFYSRLTLGTKIMILAVGPVLAALGTVYLTILRQHHSLQASLTQTVRQQSLREASMVARNVYLLCASTEARNQKDLAQHLGVARALLDQAGGLRPSPETVAWRAINQFTQAELTITLPKMTLQRQWLGQIADAAQPAFLVDDVRRTTGSFCTVFQRMNEAGDMLRISTSVLKTDGTRALGTYIPARLTSGENNPIIATVLRGDTYLGRAFVVNDWHAAAYQPLWDETHQRVIGMLYVGVPLARINQELRQAILQMSVGKTGYVFVVGTQGEQRGRYQISAQGKRDGETIWENKDAAGNFFVQDLVRQALTTRDGQTTHVRYPWHNPGETGSSRMKLVALTYYPPWDWAIGAGAYEDDFAEISHHVDQAETSLMRWVALVAACSALAALAVGIVFSRSLSRPIVHVITGLGSSAGKIVAAAGQVSSASQHLAEGSSEQAASLEETSASLEEMASMTKRNAESATQANALARSARETADTGATDMQAMGQAMQAIKSSSDDIAKIIKTIDEIAFQTNILALNAAVEAARAGEAGAGFAVVAEEVRALAQRSAQAAKETALQIESAITKTTQGVQISDLVAQRLGEIVEKVRQVDTLISEVATASREQNQGVQQINDALTQMDKVVQANAGNAEESAAAATELDDQAQRLKEAIRELQTFAGHHSGR